MRRQLGPDLIQPARGDRVKQLGEIAFDARHDRFAFGIAEADVIFDELRALAREHQARVEHPRERRSRVRESLDRRPDDLVHRLLLELGSQHGCRAVRAHSARVWPGVAFADALMVLCRREGDCGFAVDQREQAGLLAFEELLDDHRSVAGSVDRRFSFLARHSDRDALARGEAVRLDHDGDGELLQSVTRCSRRFDPDVAGGGNSISRAKVLGETLGPLELRGGGIGPENREARTSKSVRNPGDQRCFGPNDH